MEETRSLLSLGLEYVLRACGIAATGVLLGYQMSEMWKFIRKGT